MAEVEDQTSARRPEASTAGELEPAAAPVKPAAAQETDRAEAQLVERDSAVEALRRQAPAKLNRLHRLGFNFHEDQRESPLRGQRPARHQKYMNRV